MWVLLTPHKCGQLRYILWSSVIYLHSWRRGKYMKLCPQRSRKRDSRLSPPPHASHLLPQVSHPLTSDLAPFILGITPVTGAQHFLTCLCNITRGAIQVYVWPHIFPKKASHLHQRRGCRFATRTQIWQL